MYRSLNRIQSRIFQTAFTSNQNLLVCAPTGAGKTNIAMVSVLREIGQHMRQGVIQKQDFKVVYVAPMKALAAEVTAAFSRRLGPMGTLHSFTLVCSRTLTSLSQLQDCLSSHFRLGELPLEGGRKVACQHSQKRLAVMLPATRSFTNRSQIGFMNQSLMQLADQSHRM